MNDAGLQGRLADFTLEEILQLIALQQKTGLLSVEASYPMFLAFDSGMLVAYRDRRRAGVDPLAEYLRSYGFFEVAAWDNIEFVESNSKLDLTEILVNEDLMSGEELERVQFEAAQEDIFRGMQLRDGHYHFTPGPDAIAGLKGRVRFKVDGLLMESVRRIDEIAGLRKIYYSNDQKIRRTDLEFAPAGRSPSERVLLELLGHENLLGVLVANARMAEFETLSYLEQMRADGIIAVQETPQEEIRDSRSVMRRALRGERYSRRPFVLSAVAVALAAAFAWFQPVKPWATANVGTDPGPAYQIHRERAILVAAAELYTLQRGRPPQRLGDLVRDGWLGDRDLAACGEHFEYRVEGSGWSIVEREPRSSD